MPAEVPAPGRFRVIILGNDTQLFARPATPVQLARACLELGYDFVAPASWGDELVAHRILETVRTGDPGPTIAAHCPRVMDALASGLRARAAVCASVAPPVAVARYLRAAFGPRDPHLTFVGRCDAGGDERIDEHLTPESLMARLLEAGLPPADQPNQFDGVLPADRSRHVSLGGGAPHPAALRRLAAASLHDVAPETAATVARTCPIGARAVLDLALSCGCDCARDRLALERVEPPRAAAPVVDLRVKADLAAEVPKPVARPAARPSPGPLPAAATQRPAQDAAVKAAASPTPSGGFVDEESAPLAERTSGGQGLVALDLDVDEEVLAAIDRAQERHRRQTPDGGVNGSENGPNVGGAPWAAHPGRRKGDVVPPAPGAPGRVRTVQGAAPGPGSRRAPDDSGSLAGELSFLASIFSDATAPAGRARRLSGIPAAPASGAASRDASPESIAATAAQDGSTDVAAEAEETGGEITTVEMELAEPAAGVQVASLAGLQSEGDPWATSGPAAAGAAPDDLSAADAAADTRAQADAGEIELVEALELADDFASDVLGERVELGDAAATVSATFVADRIGVPTPDGVTTYADPSEDPGSELETLIEDAFEHVGAVEASLEELDPTGEAPAPEAEATLESLEEVLGVREAVVVWETPSAASGELAVRDEAIGDLDLAQEGPAVDETVSEDVEERPTTLEPALDAVDGHPHAARVHTPSPAVGSPAIVERPEEPRPAAAVAAAVVTDSAAAVVTDVEVEPGHRSEREFWPTPHDQAEIPAKSRVKAPLLNGRRVAAIGVVLLLLVGGVTVALLGVDRVRQLLPGAAGASPAVPNDSVAAGADAPAADGAGAADSARLEPEASPPADPMPAGAGVGGGPSGAVEDTSAMARAARGAPPENTIRRAPSPAVTNSLQAVPDPSTPATPAARGNQPPRANPSRIEQPPREDSLAPTVFRSNPIGHESDSTAAPAEGETVFKGGPPRTRRASKLRPIVPKP